MGNSIEEKLARTEPPPKPPEKVGELRVSHYDRLIRSLGKGPVRSVLELVQFIEDGRRELLEKPGVLARESGIPYHLLVAILASREFHRFYFDYINKRVFKPDVLEAGMELLAQDFTDPDVSTRDRLAIFHALKELFGLTPTQKVEHEVKGQATFEIRLKVQATPGDLMAAPDDFIDVNADPLELEDAGDAGGVPEPAGEERPEEANWE